MLSEPCRSGDPPSSTSSAVALRPERFGARHRSANLSQDGFQTIQFPSDPFTLYRSTRVRSHLASKQIDLPGKRSDHVHIKRLRENAGFGMVHGPLS